MSIAKPTIQPAVPIPKVRRQTPPKQYTMQDIEDLDAYQEQCEVAELRNRKREPSRLLPGDL